MLPIRNLSHLLLMCCNFWECINSHKIGQGYSTPLKDDAWAHAGGQSHWKVVRGRTAPRTPFTDQFLAPKTQHFKSFFSYWDPTSIFWKLHIFRPNFCCFWLNFSSWHTILAKSCSQDSNFKTKNWFWRPNFWKPEQHIPILKNFWSTHLGAHASLSFPLVTPLK